MALKALVLSFALGHVVSDPVTPVSKVVQLLEDLRTEVQNDGTAEASAYDAYACFCKDTTKTKSDSITGGQDTIDSTSATIEQKTAQNNEKIAELNTRQAKDVELKGELESTTVRCAKEKATYEATEADLSKALNGLNGAIKAIGDSKPASFLAVKKSVRESLALADALGLIPNSKKQVVTAFLQKAGVDPEDPEFKFHSQGIIDTLNELLQDFTTQINTLNDEWGKTEQTCIHTKASLGEEISDNADAIGLCKTRIETLTGEIADNRQNLVTAEAVLTDDQAYLKDLTVQCEARAKDWDQRSQQRNDEISALSQALTILSNGVVTQDATVNQRAFVQSAPAKKEIAPSFVQVQQHNNLVRDGLSQAKLEKVTKLLGGEARRLSSTVLSSVAAHAAADPFLKVKTLIQGLVERLLKEATSEATKKGFCDTEMGKAESDRDHRHVDTEKLSAALGSLFAKKDQLTEDIATLTSDLETLRTTLADATKARSDEKTVNLETLKTAKEGLDALTQALTVLKAYYKSAAKADKYHSGELDKAALLQASPVDEDTDGPGFGGAYKGKQEASTGIIGLLEVIKSDFERTIKTTSSAEKTAAAEHVEFDRVSLADISGKDTKKTLNQEDLATTTETIEQKLEDLNTAQELLDSALRRLDDLKPTCVDLTMPYATRVAKREEEMAALKRALCILDTEGVEDECSI